MVITLMFRIVLALVGTLLASAPLHAQAPNIVLIYADDLGYGELGCYGQTKIKTPNIDALAKRGMRFTRFYAGAPVCAPSRCVLMTGKSLYRAQIRDNTESGGWGPEEPEGQRSLDADEVTIAELLHDAGYATGAFGKWGLGGPGSTGHPRYQGFDHFYGYLCQRVAHNYFPTHLWRNHDVDVQHNNTYFEAHQRVETALDTRDVFDEYTGGDYAPQAIREELLNWLRERDRIWDNQPFFAYYPTILPHLALQVPHQYVDRYPREWDERPYLGERGYLPHARPRAAYAAMISYLDESVGMIVELLEELEELDNTIIILTSDNGSGVSGHGGADTAFFNSHAGLRGEKGKIFDGGIRVPCIAAWPGTIPPDTTTERFVGAQDIMATLCEAAGIAPAEAADSISFLPTLKGNEQPARPFLFWEFHGYGGQQAIIDDGWKLVRRKMKRDPSVPILYNLRDDPLERKNLAGKEPEVVNRLLQLMKDNRVPSKIYRFGRLGD